MSADDDCTWVRLCDAVSALKEPARVTVSRIELGEVRTLETPQGIHLHIEDLLEIARGQQRCADVACPGSRCLSSACTDRRAAEAFAGEVAARDVRRVARVDADRLRRRGA